MSRYIIPVAVSVTDKLIKRYPSGEEPMDEALATSYLGTPVYSQLELSTNGIESQIGNPTTLNPSEGATNIVLQTVLITVTQQKNIIKTDIQGRNGTVKEYISDGDYQINIRGSIVSPFSMVYPKDEVDLLLRYCRVNKRIQVFSDFLKLFQITDIVIENYNFGQKLGSINEQPFEIIALSDQPIEFDLSA